MTVTYYEKPKLVFKRVPNSPLELQYGNAYYPGCFTMTGITYDNADYLPMLKWCEDNNCGKQHEYIPDRLVFESAEQIMWFLLHWQ